MPSISPLPSTLLLAGLVVMAGLPACKTREACGPADDGSVVACVDGDEVTHDEAREHLRAVEPVPGSAAVPDPGAAAVEAAVRVRLFAAEARRRGLTVPAARSEAHRRAALHQALIRDETQREGIDPGAISDDEARRYYERHPGRFNKVFGTHCRAIFVSDADRAEALYAQVAAGGEERFARVARDHSEDASAADGGDIGEAHRPELDGALTRLANTLRAEGEVGGPVQLSDGRYVILYASRLEMNVAPFDGHMAARVKNHLANERERAALDELYGELRARSNVSVFADAVASMARTGDTPSEPDE